MDKEFINNTLDHSDSEDSIDGQLSITTESMSNVVSDEKLKVIQSKTLRRVAEYISSTFGPMGSNTKIIVGNDPQNITSKYSKDGLTVLKNIVFQDPIEASILSELIEITRHVEHEVGDGTTSTVIMSSYIFDELNKIQHKYKIQPYTLISKLNDVISNIKHYISDQAKECTVDDIYSIAMISTNGNKEISNDIRDIYNNYGMDVDLSVGISNDEHTKTATYDGITIKEGMSDPVYVNNYTENTCSIHNAHVYYFSDPIDTHNMVAYLGAIIKHNIYDYIADDLDPIPTVICAPRISRDAEFILKDLVEDLYKYQNSGMDKPPICIITEITASDEIIMDDIANLCGCKKIKKYIDPEIYKQDQENGLAPTVENVHEFYGYCEEVVADTSKTKFINPEYMFAKDENGEYVKDEDGELIRTDRYDAMVSFLETELKNAEGEDAATKGTLRKRLAALKANMVDYLVGGITIADRDAKKDLAEDAIKNCRSAAKYGVGYAANFEGLRACADIENDVNDSDINADIFYAIYGAYVKISNLLYSTVYDNPKDKVLESLENRKPFNIRTNDNLDVLCSIRLDIEILDTISKIISLMVTCNQCLLQAPQLNKY